MRMLRQVVLAAVTVVATFGCSSGDGGGQAREGATTSSGVEQAFPDVVGAEVTAEGDSFTVAATISSPYDSDDRYADAFRVLGPTEEVLGVRELTHPHADEQPFTRSLSDVVVPDDVAWVTVQARDLVNGWGGETVTVAVPDR